MNTYPTSIIGLLNMSQWEAMSMTSKIDVLDMIISVLTEHEKRQDELTEKLEKTVNTLIYFFEPAIQT